MHDPIIALTNLTKRYGKLVAVDKLNLTIHKGEIFGLLGPNGAGKTTSILMMLGLTEPCEGTAYVCGYNATRQPIDVKKKVGYLPDSVGFYDNLSGLDNLVFIGKINGLAEKEARETAVRLLETVGLTQDMHKKTGAYSRGMKQRLGLADVLIKNPEVIILDEPTLGIDPSGVQAFLTLIKQLSHQQGLTVLLSSHHLHHVQQVCDRVGIFVDGKLLVEGNIASLSKNLFDKEGYVTAITLQSGSGLESIVEELGQEPHVKQVSLQDNKLEVLCEEDITANIVHFLVHKQCDIIGVHRKDYGLDEIYQKYFENKTHNSSVHEKSFSLFQRPFFKKRDKQAPERP